MKVFNLVGQEVRTLVEKRQQAGSHQIGVNGAGLASGLYFYTLDAGDFRQTRKLILLN
ncbi:MAG TPA: T9SS type A sorting domain-containing protein [Bacteroidota bacterium]